MTLQVLIYEDLLIGVHHLQALINNWQTKTGVKVRCKAFSDGRTLDEQMIEDSDLIIIDDIMPFIGGVDTAKRIRKWNANVPLVYMADNPERAFETHGLNLFRYLIKPLSQQNCNLCLERAMGYQILRRTNYIQFEHANGFLRLPASEILYIESQNRGCHVVSLRGEKWFAGSFASILQQLPKGGLLQCHRSYIVNCMHIVSMEKGHIQLDPRGDILYSSRLAKDIRAELSKQNKGILQLNLSQNFMPSYS